MNKTSENVTYLIDNKTFLCLYKKLHPLRDRRRNGFQKQCRETLKNNSEWFTEIYHFREWRRFIKSEIDSL